MNSKWRVTTIQEFIDRGEADMKTGPFGTQMHASDYVESGTPVINVRNIGFGSVVPEKLEFIDEKTVRRLKDHLLQRNDIVFGRKGAVERHALIRSQQDGWFQGSDCLRLRLSSRELTPIFLSYSFLTDSHKKWMMNQCSHGVTMASLNQAIVSRIPIKLPDIGTQNQITNILSAYDDLIENNTRRIKILEEMSQMIYREWFVNFRFPGHEKVNFVKSELGRIPDGWCQQYPDYVDYLEGPGLRRWQYRDSGLRFLNIRTIADGDIDLSKTQFVDPVEAEIKYRHFLLSEYDHVVSSSGTIWGFRRR